MPLFPVFSLGLRQRFAIWQRLEPRCRSSNFSEGLAARVGDPLWLLTRQWQMGEFLGADAGSPVKAELSYSTAPVTHVQLGTAAEVPLDGAPPLEALVERERLQLTRNGSSINYRMRVRAGARLERELRRRLASGADAAILAYRRAYPLELPTGSALAEVDRATRRYVALMTGRVVDGLRALDAMGPTDPPVLPPGVILSTSLRLALQAFRAWRAAFISEPAAANPAWSPAALNYSFRLRASDAPGSDTVLSAPRYRNGELDWHSFSVDSVPSAVSPAPTSSQFLPTGMSFGGMPNRRWWAFEDGRTNFGDIDVTTTDVAKLALMEFALVYSDDWFMYPVVVPAGSVTRIHVLRVMDSFGGYKDIPRARTEGTSAWNRWELFTLTPTGNARGKGIPEILFVPPAVGFREESEPVEHVRLARDEGANKVWGIERTIMNALGDAIVGAGAHRERVELIREASGTPSTAAPIGALTAEEQAMLRYRLATTVPSNWIPFAPARDNEDGTRIKLRRAQMLLSEDASAPGPVPAISELLSGAASPRTLNEETVLRNGLTLLLTRQRVRWVDGKTYTWLGRGVRIGHGEAASGLRFDVVTDPPRPTVP